MLEDKSSTVNLIIAIALSMLIMFGWSAYSAKFQKATKKEQTSIVKNVNIPQVPVKIITREDAIENTSRISLENSDVKLSINLKGLQVDDLIFKKDNEVLFSPSDTKSTYFAQIGMIGVGAPDNNAVWKVKSQGENNADLYFINNSGTRFDVQIALDEQFMLKFVPNSTDKNIRPFARIFREFASLPKSNMMLHEGVIANADGKIVEVDYDDLEKTENIAASKAWIGISDKYTLASIYAESVDGVRFVHSSPLSFQVDTVTSLGQEIFLFAGKKDIKTLDFYQTKYSIPKFDKAINFGVLYFLTKPISMLLTWLYGIFSNFGIAIALLTLIIKLAILPFSIKSSVSMAKMKSIGPRLADIKERYRDDKMLAAQATMQLYREEKINPLAGFMSILMQIPIFFALYKVLYISSQMHGAPLFLWIQDLSAPDPLSILNLFGLLPWHASTFLSPLAIALGTSTFIYQMTSPRMVDKNQNTIMKIIPIIMAVFMSSFASGLLLYWIVNNLLSSAQQIIIEKVFLKKNV